jgi:hypothetical protein
VRPVHVVVIDEHAEHTLEVATIHDQQRVEGFSPGGTDKPFGGRVRLRRSHWGLHHVDALAREDGVEAARELGVAIADQEPEPGCLLLERPGNWRACCVTQLPVGLAVHPARWTRRLPSSMKKRT